MTPFNIKMNSLKADSTPHLQVSVKSSFLVNLDILEESSLIFILPSSSLVSHQILFILLLEDLYSLLFLTLV